MVLQAASHGIKIFLDAYSYLIASIMFSLEDLKAGIIDEAILIITPPKNV